MTTLSPLFLGIQVGLLAVSTLLLGGAVYGLGMRAGDMSPDTGPSQSRTGGSSSVEKRRRGRMPCNLFLELLKGDQVAGTGRLVNLSPSGACFVSNTVLHSGDYIMARLPALRNGVNKISGQVVWRKKTPTKTVYGLRLNRETPA